MINFLRKLQYKTVAVHQIQYVWTDTGGSSLAVVIMKENGFGRRKIAKEGSLYPMSHEQHPFWQQFMIPWREGVLDEISETLLTTVEKPGTVRKQEGNVVYLND